MVTKLIVTCAMLATVSACSTTDRIETLEVKVPVEVPCQISIPEKPDYDFDKLDKSDNIFKKVQALLSDRLKEKVYQRTLETALTSCTGS